MSLKSSQEAVLLDNPDPGTTIVLLTRIRILYLDSKSLHIKIKYDCLWMQEAHGSADS